ncbi:MAG: DUF4276 family protein [Fimbriimonadaceae bacterium]|nr:DUF4276 family protein [Fimbriimonadaceae bacterium]
MTNLVILVEEESMRAFLEPVLTRHLPGLPTRIISHNGRKSLRESTPRKLRSFPEGTSFLILEDRDGRDCHSVKQDLVSILPEGKNAVVRIVCDELEAWHIGDLTAVAHAMGKEEIARLVGKRQYRDPDALSKPSIVLKRIVPEYQKVTGSRQIGRFFDPSRCTSRSFQVFWKSLTSLTSD